MNYEQKYKEVLERAKKMRDSIIGSHNPESARLHVGHIENIFPELRESEDERIRQFLVELLSSGTWKKEWPFQPNECVAYLEKLKEQKPVDEPFEEWIDGWYNEHHRDGYITMDEREFKNFCRGIKNMYQQKPAEWSEKDENALEYLHELIGFGYSEKFMDAQTAADMREWVNKSLRPSWKPSGEQMKDSPKWEPTAQQIAALEMAVEEYGKGDPVARELTILLHELKKKFK